MAARRILLSARKGLRPVEGLVPALEFSRRGEPGRGDDREVAVVNFPVVDQPADQLQALPVVAEIYLLAVGDVGVLERPEYGALLAPVVEGLVGLFAPVEEVQVDAGSVVSSAMSACLLVPPCARVATSLTPSGAA